MQNITHTNTLPKLNKKKRYSIVYNKSKLRNK